MIAAHLAVVAAAVGAALLYPSTELSFIALSICYAASYSYSRAAHPDRHDRS